jgi:hypothetical protein
LGHFPAKRERETGAQEVMNPIWSPEAIADLPALRAYRAQDDPAAAQRVALHIVSAHRRAWIDRLSALKII